MEYNPDQWVASWNLINQLGLNYPLVSSTSSVAEYCNVADFVAGPVLARGINVGLNIRGKPGAAYLDISGFWFYHIDYAPILVSFLTEFDDCLPIFQQYLESYGLVSYLDNLDQVVASRLGLWRLKHLPPHIIFYSQQPVQQQLQQPQQQLQPQPQPQPQLQLQTQRLQRQQPRQQQQPQNYAGPAKLQQQGQKQIQRPPATTQGNKPCQPKTPQSQQKQPKEPKSKDIQQAPSLPPSLKLSDCGSINLFLVDRELHIELNQRPKRFYPKEPKPREKPKKPKTKTNDAEKESKQPESAFPNLLLEPESGPVAAVEPKLTYLEILTKEKEKREAQTLQNPTPEPPTTQNIQKQQQAHIQKLQKPQPQTQPVPYTASLLKDIETTRGRELKQKQIQQLQQYQQQQQQQPKNQQRQAPAKKPTKDAPTLADLMLAHNAIHAPKNNKKGRMTENGQRKLVAPTNTTALTANSARLISKSKAQKQPTLKITDIHGRKVKKSDLVQLNPASTDMVVKHGKERAYKKPKKTTKLKRIILEEREEEFKKWKEEQGEDFEELVKTVEKEIEAEVMGEALKRNLPMRNVGQREKRDRLLKKIPKPVSEALVRSYCTQILTAEHDFHLFNMLTTLTRFQERQKSKDEMKAKMRKRYVIGLREVQRGIMSEKVKAIVVAPGIDANSAKDGLDDRVAKILQSCEEKNILVSFGLTRKRLAEALNKKPRMSVVGIYNPDGSDIKRVERCNSQLTMEEVRLSTMRHMLYYQLQQNVIKQQKILAKDRSDSQVSREPLVISPYQTKIESDLLTMENEKLRKKLAELEEEIRGPVRRVGRTVPLFSDPMSDKTWTIFIDLPDSPRSFVLTGFDPENTIQDLKKIEQLSADKKYGISEVVRSAGKQILAINGFELVSGPLSKFEGLSDFSTFTLFRGNKAKKDEANPQMIIVRELPEKFLKKPEAVEIPESNEGEESEDMSEDDSDTESTNSGDESSERIPNTLEVATDKTQDQDHEANFSPDENNSLPV